ncbi:MAG: hypothetical protein ACRDHY_12200 [Anaerolineales bacterium]
MVDPGTTEDLDATGNPVVGRNRTEPACRGRDTLALQRGPGTREDLLYWIKKTRI